MFIKRFNGFQYIVLKSDLEIKQIGLEFVFLMLVLNLTIFIDIADSICCLVLGFFS